MTSSVGKFDKRVLGLALGRIEAIEYSSLVWGSVDGGFAREQLEDELALLLVEEGSLTPEEDAENLLEELVERAMLCECATMYGGLVFRSRFAEGVRLFSRLRQIFPGRGWRTAPSLVADYRVDHRPRRYPARNLDPADVRATIQKSVSLSPLSCAVWDRIVPPRSDFLLSGFQVRAAETVLKGKKKGAIVTAGTGSGKTLAFYLPALVKLAELVQQGQFWTKCLAVYPRVELLKDQFSETLALCETVAPILREHGRRPFLVGTFFMKTPKDAKDVEKKWLRSRRVQGWTCPYTKCQAPGGNGQRCGGDLVWVEVDVRQNKERLVCERCHRSIEDDSIILTRKRAKQKPPDILFITMEMVHKQIADPECHKLLGIGVHHRNKVPLVLLDEVHTYSGMTGAQSALVLRRWQHSAGASPSFVGLSATLREAQAFFEQLTGVPEHLVTAIAAHEDEMIYEGAEYQLVLKGNAVSQSSLLSTSIQSAMLMPRLLDTVAKPKSRGNFGMRTFAFTDDLDVNTRLFDDLCDAEGVRTGSRRRRPLAGLRGPDPDEQNPSLREVEGQRWILPERVGHTLSNPLVLGRTSSRDPGVNGAANLIVATSSLEVGYNDAKVGAVMQHKAPLDMASFLQRKGRAGRPRGMRPWTVTVLSAFGRDRIAYQNYDQLFDPVLTHQNLPIHNLYLLRMQALAAFFDWLALDWASRGGKGWLWATLAEPASNRYKNNIKLQKHTIATIRALLERDEQTLGALKRYLQAALSLNEDEVLRVLYSPPRSLLFEALPTLQRRLVTAWQKADDSGSDVCVKFLPLPEFIAPNLFSQLALPEVQLDIEGRDDSESISVKDALGKVLPGRVNRRYAENDATLSHWVPVPPGELLAAYRESDGKRLYLDHPLEEYVIGEPLGQFALPDSDETIPVLRPWRMQLSRLRDQGVSNKSNAFSRWLNEIHSRNTSWEFSPAKRSKWRRIIQGVGCYLHAQGASITVRRYSIGADASLSINRLPVRVQFTFVGKDGSPTALGMEFETDGLAVRYRLPLAKQLLDCSMSPELHSSTRRAFFREAILNDPYLKERVDNFKRDWLQQVYLVTLLTCASVENISIEEAHAIIRKRDDAVAFRQAMKAVLGMSEEEGAEGDDPALAETLTGLLENPEIRGRLHELASVAYAPDPEAYGQWLRNKIHLSMAGAIHDSCLHNIPRHATMETLLVDAQPLEDDSELAVVWVTEDSLGGAGVMEALVERLQEQPGRFFSGIEAAVAMSDKEFTASILEQVVRGVVDDPKLAASVKEMRTAVFHEERDAARKALLVVLKERGVVFGKAESVALNARLLRPGTQPETDAYIVEFLDHWDKLQADLGIALGLGEYCAITALVPGMRERIRRMAPPGCEFDDLDAVAQLAGILWPRGYEIRQHSLYVYNPYRGIRPASMWTDPQLIRECVLKGTYHDVHLDDPEWMAKILKALSFSETCRLLAPNGRQRELAGAVASLLLQPVDVGYLQFYPVVERVEQDARQHAVFLGIWEDI